MKLRVTRSTHGKRIDGRLKIFEKGDVFDGTESELKAFSDRLEVVNSSSKQPTPSTSNEDDGRDELIEQAKELGIKFHPNIGSEKLKAKIDEALNGDS